MNDSCLPENLLALIRTSIPTINAAELLVFLARHPENPWAPGELVSALKPTVISLSATEEYLSTFKIHGLVRKSNRRYCYSPDSPESGKGVEALMAAFNERPVTLIRTIYNVADQKIQSFADSFKFKKE